MEEVTQTSEAQSNVTVENHLTGAILVTIFCCWPLGIPAILSASKVNTLLSAGNVTGAEEASAQAKKWIKLAAILGGIAILASVLLNVLAVVMGAAAGSY